MIHSSVMLSFTLYRIWRRPIALHRLRSKMESKVATG